MPTLSSSDLILASLQQILQCLKDPKPASPVAPITSAHHEAIVKLAELLTNVVRPEIALPTRPMSNPLAVQATITTLNDTISNIVSPPADAASSPSDSHPTIIPDDDSMSPLRVDPLNPPPAAPLRVNQNGANIIEPDTDDGSTTAPTLPIPNPSPVVDSLHTSPTTTIATSGPLMANQKYPLGTPVLKKFDAGLYHGKVTKFLPGLNYYHVVYEDDDEEDLALSELEAILLPSVAVPTTQRRRAKTALDPNISYADATKKKSRAKNPVLTTNTKSTHRCRTR